LNRWACFDVATGLDLPIKVRVTELVVRHSRWLTHENGNGKGKAMQRIAITGSSGYYGRKLVEQIRHESPRSRILGLDVAPPRDNAPDEFAQVDIRDPQLRSMLADFQPDTIIHLAFVVNPIHNKKRMHDINVGGTRNVFEAVRTLRPARFLTSSSATAYGAWPDNPIPMPENWRLRAREKFQYAADKTLLDYELQALSAELPDVAVSWTRAAIIGGKGANNFLSRMLLKMPWVVLPSGNDTPLQFVHEEDCVAATWEILCQDARGPFNIGPNNWMTLTSIAKLTNRRVFTLPLWLFKYVSWYWWHLRLPVFDYPPSLHDFLRHAWVVAPTRLEKELGFRFRYTAEETVLEMWNEHQRTKRGGASGRPFASSESNRRAA
jgi:UDP-glucose 4-epimerase